MAFPSVLNTFNRPTTTDRLNSPSHSALHNTVSSALGQVEAVIGVDGANSVVGTIMSDLRNPASGGGGHVQVANKGGTGQTAYTKGDILVAQSASVLTKLSLGTDGYRLTADSTVATGVKWASGSATITSYLSSGTWTKPAGLNFIEIQMWGGGGSGGMNSNTFGGGGGGGGGYAYGRFAASLLGTTEQINIGVGGASVASAANGNAGTNTVFGASSLLVAYGGGAGGGNVGVAKGGGGGGGGTASVGGNASGVQIGIGGRPVLSSVIAGSGASGADATGGGAWGGGDGTGGGWAVLGGGGGGCGEGNSSGNTGGNSLYGGGGGAGGRDTNAATGATGGVSKLGGNGGVGGGSGAAGAGTVPAGGGGGAFTGPSGKGADGKVIIYEYL